MSDLAPLLGMAASGRVQEAEAAARQLLAVEPANGGAALHLVSAIRWQRDSSRYPEAIDLGHALLASLPAPVLQPNGTLGMPAWVDELRENLAGMLFELGWDAEACRIKFVAQYGKPGPKLWTGQPLAGRTLLVAGHPTKDVAGELLPFGQVGRLDAARILWRTPDVRRWRPLMQRSDKRVTVIGSTAPPQRFDYYVQHCDLMNLTLADGRLVRPVRYLEPDPQAVARYAALLPRDRPRVGLAWRGGLPGRADYRNPPLAAFVPLAGLSAQLVCLQYGNVSEDLEQFRGLGLDVARVDGWDPLESLDDAAALAEACDVIVTNEQSMAHVAGALGKPTYLLSAFYSHLTTYGPPGRSVFYPSLRVLTQPRLGRWDPVMTELRHALLQTDFHAI